MTVVAPSNLDQLELEVQAAKDELVLLKAGQLRDLSNESRLKSLARERIQEKLSQRGLVALPDVPDWQEHLVYITRLGSDVFKLFSALNDPSEANLEKLHGAASGTSIVVKEQKQIAEAFELASELSEVLNELAAESKS